MASEAEATQVAAAVVADEETVAAAEPATGAGGDAGAVADAGAADTAGSADKKKKKKKKRWLPLESNPDVMNKYIEGLGFPTVMYQFVDVLSTDDWALEMVPRPVRAVMLLFPIKKKTEEHRAEEAARIAKDGQKVDDDLYYTKQTVGNACGTVGLIHAVSNIADCLGGDVPLLADSFFTRFLTATKNMNPDERAQYLEDDEELDAAQNTATREGVTTVPDVDESVETHFICFTHKNGSMYELDGRKATPINHGACTADTLLEKACAQVREFMKRDPEEVRFAITALAATTD